MDRRIRYIKAINIDDIDKQNEALEIFSNFIEPGDFNNISFIEVGDEEIAFILLDEIKTNKIVDAFRDLGILIEEKDVTDDILRGNYNKDEIEDSFLYIIDEFILKNLTVDIVLDKINEKGIESLNKIDYQILKTLDKI